MSLRNITLPSPAWAVNAVAAFTFLLQGLPKVTEASGVVAPEAQAYINLTCDVLNVVVAAVAVFLGTPKNVNQQP